MTQMRPKCVSIAVGLFPISLVLAVLLLLSTIRIFRDSPYAHSLIAVAVGIILLVSGLYWKVAGGTNWARKALEIYCALTIFPGIPFIYDQCSIRPVFAGIGFLLALFNGAEIYLLSLPDADRWFGRARGLARSASSKLNGAFDLEKAILPLVRELAEHRIRTAEPAAPFVLEVLRQLTDDELIGLPEATIVMIVHLYLYHTGNGLTNRDALRLIELMRSPPLDGPITEMTTLEEYVKARVFTEFADSRGAFYVAPWRRNEEFFEYCIDQARSLFEATLGVRAH